MNINFSDCLKKIMNCVDLKCSKLAKEINFEPSSVYKWLNGSRIPSVNNVKIVINNMSSCMARYLYDTNEYQIRFLNMLKDFGYPNLNLRNFEDFEKVLVQILTNSYSYSKNEFFKESTPIFDNIKLSLCSLLTGGDKIVETIQGFLDKSSNNIINISNDFEIFDKVKDKIKSSEHIVFDPDISNIKYLYKNKQNAYYSKNLNHGIKNAIIIKNVGAVLFLFNFEFGLVIRNIEYVNYMYNYYNDLNLSEIFEKSDFSIENLMLEDTFDVNLGAICYLMPKAMFESFSTPKQVNNYNKFWLGYNKRKHYQILSKSKLLKLVETHATNGVWFSVDLIKEYLENLRVSNIVFVDNIDCNFFIQDNTTLILYNDKYSNEVYDKKIIGLFKEYFFEIFNNNKEDNKIWIDKLINYLS